MQLLIEETVAPYTSSAVTQTVRTSHKNILPLEVLMSNIKGMFVNYTEYREYVKKHDLTKHGYPLNPKKVYGYKLTVDEFLGNPHGTFRESQTNAFKQRRIWEYAHQKLREKGDATRKRIQQEKEARRLELEEQKKARLFTTRSKPAVKLTNSNDRLLDMEIICDFLIYRGMTNTVKNILSEPKVTLEDARMISNVLLRTYEDKTLVKK